MYFGFSLSLSFPIVQGVAPWFINRYMPTESVARLPIDAALRQNTVTHLRRARVAKIAMDLLAVAGAVISALDFDNKENAIPYRAPLALSGLIISTAAAIAVIGLRAFEVSFEPPTIRAAHANGAVEQQVLHEPGADDIDDIEYSNSSVEGDADRAVAALPPEPATLAGDNV